MPCCLSERLPAHAIPRPACVQSICEGCRVPDGACQRLSKVQRRFHAFHSIPRQLQSREVGHLESAFNEAWDSVVASGGSFDQEEARRQLAE